MRILRLAHLYGGLLLALFMLVVSGTGAALVYKEAYWRLVYPELRGSVLVSDTAEQAAAIAAAHAQYGAALRSVKMPVPGVAAYQLYLHGAGAFLARDDHRIIDEWRTSERLMSLLFDLHAHLMAGRSGELVVGSVGLVGLFMAISGLLLWWPSRRRFSLANLWPRSLTRREMLFWHRDIGALMSPLLLLILLTGCGMVWYGTAQQWLNGLFGDDVPVTVKPALAADTRFETPDAAVLRRVVQALPGARIVFYYPPQEGSAVAGFRLRQPCELHPNGRSYVYVNAHDGEILQASDACAMPPGERTTNLIYPLHAGKAGSAVYKLLVLLSAVALMVLSFSGVVSYLQKIRQHRTRAAAVP